MLIFCTSKFILFEHIQNKEKRLYMKILNLSSIIKINRFWNNV